jgi:hypothetical protein
MFSFKKDGTHYPLPIRDALDWARSARGEWNPNVDDGCSRYGFCSVDVEEEEQPAVQPQLVLR